DFSENFFNVKEPSGYFGQVDTREMTGRLMGKFIWSNIFTYLMKKAAKSYFHKIDLDHSLIRWESQL
ncbi:10750_t:CDS:1, partial [Paraglomus brasilianum]